MHKRNTGGDCKEIPVEGKGYGLYCAKTLDKSKVPDLYFQFGEVTLKFPAKELFKNHYLNRRDEEEYGLVTKIYGVRQMSVMYVGTPLIKYYHTVFDMEKQRIGFGDHVDVFADASIEQRRRGFRPRWRHRRRNIWSLYVLIALVLILIIVGIYLYLKRRKTKKKVKGYSKKERLIDPIGTPMVNIG